MARKANLTKGVRASIQPTDVFTLTAAAEALGLPSSCLPREVRLGRLRVSKRAGRYFVLGRQLLAWIEAGEVVRRTKAPPSSPASDPGPLGNGHLPA